MFLARVTGTVVSTAKDDGLGARKLLVVRQLDANGSDLPACLIALDAVGAGVGETVYCCRGKEAAFAWLPELVPADATIVGIVDPREGLHPAGARA
ncbi:MAG TPA: EutN/CcmL family microcompartment protein [Terriglobales bacterium]|nr:EutN/CcmL family microcompartment protein [Terriglobales bacterium]